MIIDLPQSTKVRVAFVTSVEVGKIDEQWIERCRQPNVATMLEPLQAQCLTSESLLYRRVGRRRLNCDSRRWFSRLADSMNSAFYFNESVNTCKPMV